ncbi:hypothetical protein CSPHI_11115 [Corynebacterium sphenisci DSM 44792]|uniref:Fe/B12 periplasmic-binding domain-containing protein n=1 Tax=Corynebacterium sphenisci DSM 44792 TaxID=1437874 RepID=A0A1L7CZX2_9CORY|nr:ABC transporter substrate-binding protein [Corynebacterium sphenisci]APT91435.1 hypothetical protein CSPHI_11115 [Corynebacterium sphenisci DSM 44792]
MRIGRRITAAGAAIALACGLGLAGCSSEEGDTAAATGVESTVEVEEGAFPVTIEHAYGETTIEEAPQRVVAYGENDIDPLLALGVTPVFVKEWNTPEPTGWQLEAARGELPEFYDGEEIDPEDVAAVDPDLIVAMYSGMTREQYEQLSEIAPVVPFREGYADWQQPWDITAEMIGEAIGRPQAARDLIDDIEGRFTAIRGRHPNWEGKTTALAIAREDLINAYSPDDPRSRFFAKLGMVVPEKIAELAEGGHVSAFSLEQANVLELDVVFWGQEGCTTGPGGSLATDPILGRLDVVKEGRSVCVDEFFDDPELGMAFQWQTVLSLDHVLDEIEPMLVEELGD